MSQIHDLFINRFCEACQDKFSMVVEIISYRTCESTIAYFLHVHLEFVLASVTKPIKRQNRESETLLCQVIIVKSCAKQSKLKDDRI